MRHSQKTKENGKEKQTRSSRTYPSGRTHASAGLFGNARATFGRPDEIRPAAPASQPASQLAEIAAGPTDTHANRTLPQMPPPPPPPSREKNKKTQVARKKERKRAGALNNIKYKRKPGTAV